MLAVNILNFNQDWDENDTIKNFDDSRTSIYSEYKSKGIKIETGL